MPGSLAGRVAAPMICTAMGSFSCAVKVGRSLSDVQGCLSYRGYRGEKLSFIPSSAPGFPILGQIKWKNAFQKCVPRLWVTTARLRGDMLVAGGEMCGSNACLQQNTARGGWLYGFLLYHLASSLGSCSKIFLFLSSLTLFSLPATRQPRGAG